MYVGFCSSHTSKSSVGGSVGLSTHKTFSTLVPIVYVGFCSSHTSKSSVGGSVGSTEGFPALLKTMWKEEGKVFEGAGCEM